MAEGEFALVRDHLEVAGSKPVSARGLLFHDNELYSMYADLAVSQRDEAKLRHYAPLAEETAVLFTSWPSFPLPGQTRSRLATISPAPMQHLRKWALCPT